MNDDFQAIKLERWNQLAAGGQPMLAKFRPEDISALKGAAFIGPVVIDRAAAPCDAVGAPFAIRLAEFLYGQHLAAERATAAAPILFDGWRHVHSLSAGRSRPLSTDKCGQAWAAAGYLFRLVQASKMRRKRQAHVNDEKHQFAPDGFMTLY
jgi:hypothetical protein